MKKIMFVGLIMFVMIIIAGCGFNNGITDITNDVDDYRLNYVSGNVFNYQKFCLREYIASEDMLVSTNYQIETSKISICDYVTTNVSLGNSLLNWEIGLTDQWENKATINIILKEDDEGFKMLSNMQWATLLKYSCSVGDTWVSARKAYGLTTNYTFCGNETITVAAGTFNCVKIVGDVFDGSSTTNSTIWYSKNIGIIKERYVRPYGEIDENYLISYVKN